MKPLFVLWALLLAALAGPARAADGIPPKPSPFTFVTDQAGLMQPAEAQKLANGLSRYASSTGTPVVVVTVPTLGGLSAADMARQIGDSWQIGQSGKNNGVVVLVAKQEHKVSIQAGSGLTDRITPEVTQRVISEMTPDFKQNNYFGGLRKGLNTLLLAANPSSDPRKNVAATAATPAADETPTQNNMADNAASTPADPAGAQQVEATEPPSTGLPWGTILLGGVIVIGGIFLLKRLFSGNSNNNNGGQAPNFMGNRPGGNTPNFGAPNAPQGSYPQQGGYGYGAPQQSSGPGIGGILATGAAAAAGAYIGNRMSEGHESSGADTGRQFDNSSNAGGAAAAGGGTAAADSYFSHDNNSNNDNSSSGPDYFSDNNSGGSSGGDYFSDDSSSSGGDTSGDFGGGDFSSGSDNTGSW